MTEFRISNLLNVKSKLITLFLYISFLLATLQPGIWVPQVQSGDPKGKQDMQADKQTKKTLRSIHITEINTYY